ncbi:putative maltokinase [Oscillatoria amoena NRMC-F 0135]|nr:putative maltokinase [Oscillatoria amoena NRMC-F 0135]
MSSEKNKEAIRHNEGVIKNNDQLQLGGELMVLQTQTLWGDIFTESKNKLFIERNILPLFLQKCRWFGGKARVVSKIRIEDVYPLNVEDTTYFLTLIVVEYVQRLSELYFLPMVFMPSRQLMDESAYDSQSLICRAEIRNEPGFIIDSSYDKVFRDYLLISMKRRERIKFATAVLEFNSGAISNIDLSHGVNSHILKADQSNTAIIYNDQYFFKFYRKLEREVNPDLEMVRFLSEKAGFANSPGYVGNIKLQDDEDRVIVFGLLQKKVDNRGNAWDLSTDSVGHFFKRVIAGAGANQQNVPELVDKPFITFEEAPKPIQDFVGRDFYKQVVQLGYRTAEMHLALAADQSDPAFAPENFTPHYQRELFASLGNLLRDRFNLLEGSLHKLASKNREFAKKVLSLEPDVLECLREICDTPIAAVKTRIHGDFHLGQVLFTGEDFVIIDYEGEPGFTFSERRLKKDPLKDVAGMMRSFHYAAFEKILLDENYRSGEMQNLEIWAEQWQHYISRFYLGAYMNRMGKEWSEEDNILIRTFLIEKAIYELGYELNGRPDWVIIPLRGIEYHMSRYYKERKARKPADKS